MSSVEILEKKLDSLNQNERKAALKELVEKSSTGKIELPPLGNAINVHCHTFYSYNAYGYSPSKIAWLARKKGLAIVGTVDFDVLDAAAEFFQAAKMLGLKACVGMESRVFIPEFADKVITSKGEPGISYHMGIGFVDSNLDPDSLSYLKMLHDISQKRNKLVIKKVNEYLSPVEVDYEKDVCVLIPKTNVTERHICDAYAKKAVKIFTDENELAAFWQNKLGTPAQELDLPDGYALKSAIRSKTMKQGGVGYIPPDHNSFPRMVQFNEFTIAAGGIPALTWVDGISQGEQCMEELCLLAMPSGVSAINAIPDPRYTPHKGGGATKLKNLHSLVELAEKLDLLMIVGTEMNIPGQNFVDDFGSNELKPLLPFFSKSAHIFYAHTVMQRYAGLGYMSKWAQEHFKDRAGKNKFFEELGHHLQPHTEASLSHLTENINPDQILSEVLV